MLGDVIELSIVVKDLDAAIERYGKLFGTTVHKRGESAEFGFKNAILPPGHGHIEFLQPTDPNKPVGKFLAKNGEGVYLVGFECQDVDGAVQRLKQPGVRVDGAARTSPGSTRGDAHGVFVELRHRETYDVGASHGHLPLRAAATCPPRPRRCGERCGRSCARRWATPPRSSARARGAASTASSAARWARAAGSA